MSSTKWWKNIFADNRKKEDLSINNNPSETDQSIKDIEIEVKYEFGFITFDIKEDCNIKEFMKAVKRENLESIASRVYNRALFGGHFERIDKKKIYIFSNENREYNVYSNDNEVLINERVKVSLEDEYIDDRVIKINKGTGQYKVTRMKHKKSGSTFSVKTFISDEPERVFLQLGYSEALEITLDMINNLSNIRNIGSILDLETISRYLNLTDNKGAPKVKKI